MVLEEATEEDVEVVKLEEVVVFIVEAELDNAELVEIELDKAEELLETEAIAEDSESEEEYVVDSLELKEDE